MYCMHRTDRTGTSRTCLTEKWKILGNLTLPNSSEGIIKNGNQSLIGYVPICTILYTSYEQVRCNIFDTAIGTDGAAYALNVNEKIYGLKCVVICQKLISD